MLTGSTDKELLVHYAAAPRPRTAEIKVEIANMSQLGYFTDQGLRSLTILSGLISPCKQYQPT
jgi:hypothetical protein